MNGRSVLEALKKEEHVGMPKIEAIKSFIKSFFSIFSLGVNRLKNQNKQAAPKMRNKIKPKGLM